MGRIDYSKTLRGAIAGALAASVWGAQIPLDKRAFKSDFDDIALLGKGLTRTDAWPLVGWALHVQNGALFGAVYANLAPRLPLPSWARGPVAASAENLLTWPLTTFTDRLHPARKEMPTLFANPRAFAQSTWRHLLFGVLLGEIERRLNAQEPAVAPPSHVPTASTNGHGTLEHAIPVAPE
jgi:hypothetical protein